ncbi:recombinase family protein [Streptomyces sp. NBC_01238]|uniref:recombinase family protein n=1 Tax=Streptomyces sp. NBC_01238 TaxID=2903791 RepID=UPI00386AD990
MANSHWKPHPGLAEALALGCEFDQWLGGRTPIVSYARSSRESASGGRAVGRQHVNNDGAAAARGWAVVYQYTDDGISAADPHVERPAYSRMVSDIRLGRTPEGFRIGGAIAVEEERMGAAVTVGTAWIQNVLPASRRISPGRAGTVRAGTSGSERSIRTRRGSIYFRVFCDVGTRATRVRDVTSKWEDTLRMAPTGKPRIAVPHRAVGRSAAGSTRWTHTSSQLS